MNTRPIIALLALSLLIGPTLSWAGPLSGKARRLIDASRRAPKFLVQGNTPDRFRVHHTERVQPGTKALLAKDAAGRSIWVVDHRSTYRQGPKNIASKLLDGFFCGAVRGKTASGPQMRVIAVQRKGTWTELTGKDHTAVGARKSPLTDKANQRVIVEVRGVKPVPAAGPLLRPATFQMVIERGSIKQGQNFAEFTGHFLNPGKQRGPFPGTTDGALRIRARRNTNGSVSLEEYYVTRSATQFVAPMANSVRPMALGSSLFNMGRSLFNMTPPGKMIKPLTDRGMKMAKGMTDATVGQVAGKTMFRQVAKYHTDYWERVMFTNLLK